MSGETQVDTVDTTENQSTATAETDLAEPETQDAVEETLEARADRLEKESFAKQKRIDKLTAKHTSEREARIAAEAEAQALKGKPEAQADDDPARRETYVREVGKAQAMGEVLYKQGIKTFGDDFKKSLDVLAEEAPLIGKDGLFTPLMDAISECDEPVKLIQYLGANPDIAEEFAGLKPTQISRRLALIEGDLTKTPKTSKASEPITPIGSRGKGGSKSLADLPMEEYIAERKKQGASWARNR